MIEQFIDLITGSSLRIGDREESYTADVYTSHGFYLDGHLVRFIDTAGWDDTTKNESDVLASIAAFLETSYVKLGLGLQK